MAVRVLLIDDHEVVREGLKIALKEHGLTVVGEAKAIDDAMPLVANTPADLILLDLRFKIHPEEAVHHGIDLLAEIRKEKPEIPIVIFSAFEHPAFLAKCIQLGAAGFVLKGDPIAKLIETVFTALNGKSSFNREDHRKVSGALAAPRLGHDIEAPLTHRECDVLRLLSDGATNKKIGDLLGISYETVKEHVQHLLKKIGVADRTQAAVWAMRKGILDPKDP